MSPMETRTFDPARGGAKHLPAQRPTTGGGQAPNGPLLVVRGVEKHFLLAGAKLPVLRGVDLDLERGESVALLGSSGAGKSTLLHVLGLLERPNAGSVRLDGRECWALSIQERARLRNRAIGFVFQFYHLLPELTALENVLLPAMIAHGRLSYLRNRSNLRSLATQSLTRFGLDRRLTHRPAQLSGGERQRVALARALFNDPALMIADEPTGNLDSTTGAAVLELIFEEQRRRGLTLLLVTHDESVAARCARTVHMHDGRVV